MNITDEGYLKAIEVLEHCAKNTGFYASGLPGGYEATWARDSMITSLGASLVGDKFKEPFRKSIALLAKNQSELGQIPNAVGSWNIDRKSDVTFNSIDSTLWWIIGNYVYAAAYDDTTLLENFSQNIEHAYNWLRHQDPNEDTLLVQQPTMDWQDAFPHKYGRVINTQALYFVVLKKLKKLDAAEHVRKVVNGDVEKYLSMYDAKRKYYLPWAWKNHDGDREQEHWFDALGNLLTVVTGLAKHDRATIILDYIARKKINKPFPCRTMEPPLKPTDEEWKSYFDKSAAKKPYEYLNAGVWPFIGGFYVAALVKMNRDDEAISALEKLAEAVRLGSEREWEFHEWLQGKTGKIGEDSTPYQGWTAGMYVFAYECVKHKRVPYF